MKKINFKKNIKKIQTLQRKYTQSSEAKEADTRLALLDQFKKLLNENEEAFLDALHQDLARPTLEAYATEIGILLNEIDFIQKHLPTWMKAEVKRRYLLNGVEKTTVCQEPYGSILVLAPWNYPLQLALSPVIGALSAGNAVVLKPSESAPSVSRLLSELVPQYFDKQVFHVVEGNGEIARALTDLIWDFVFFTGSPTIAQDVYQKAAKRLTPVVLELGGKNPCIVDSSGFIEESVRKIIWGKFLNTGQTCIAPDTVYVHESFYSDFLQAAEKQLKDFYGENPQTSDDYGRLVHDKHLNKMREFLEDGDIYYGGDIDETTLYMSPTLMTHIERGSALDQEEIFGPILPVVPYRDIEQITLKYRDMPTPLVTYLFSEKRDTIRYVRDQIESGSLSINEVLVHASSPHVPFGGKGMSGIGNYHGEASFYTFTYDRTVYEKKTYFELPQQFPPYAEKTLDALRRFRKRIY